MANEPSTNQQHVKFLAALCRICGENLKKSEVNYENSFNCKDNADLLSKTFGLNVQNDNMAIHPPRFCKICQSTTCEIEPVIWEAHTDTDCKTCSIAGKNKKGGRKAKPKKGRKPFSHGQRRPVTENQSAELLKKVRDISLVLTTFRGLNFNEQFERNDDTPHDLLCPICKEVLNKPLTTKCDHSFCADCFLNAVAVSNSSSCPICKMDLDAEAVLKSGRIIFNLVAACKVTCKVCKKQIALEETLTHLCDKSAPPSPAPVDPTEAALLATLDEINKGDFSPTVGKIARAYCKAQMKKSEDGKTATLKGERGKVCIRMSYSAL